MIVRKHYNFVVILIIFCLANCSASLSQRAQRDFELGEEALKREDYDGAITYFIEYLKKSPKDADAHLILGLALLKNERLREAVKEFKEAIHLDPGNEESKALIKNSIFEEVYKFSSKGNEETSMRYLMAYLTINPDDIDTHLALTRKFIKKGDTRNAIGSLNKAVSLDHRNPEVIELLDYFSGGFH